MTAMGSGESRLGRTTKATDESGRPRQQRRHHCRKQWLCPPLETTINKQGGDKRGDGDKMGEEGGGMHDNRGERARRHNNQIDHRRGGEDGGDGSANDDTMTMTTKPRSNRGCGGGKMAASRLVLSDGSFTSSCPVTSVADVLSRPMTALPLRCLVPSDGSVAPSCPSSITSRT